MEAPNDKTLDDFKNALLTEAYVPLIGDIVQASVMEEAKPGLSVTNVLISHGYSKLTADDFLNLIDSSSDAAYSQLEASNSCSYSQMDIYKDDAFKNDATCGTSPVEARQLDLRMFCGIYILQKPLALAGKVLRVDPEKGHIILDGVAATPLVTRPNHSTRSHIQWSHNRRRFHIQFHAHFHSPTKILTASFRGTTVIGDGKPEVCTGELRDRSVNLVADYAPFVDPGTAHTYLPHGHHRERRGSKPLPLATLYKSAEIATLLTYVGFGFSIIGILGIILPCYWLHIDKKNTKAVTEALHASLSSTRDKLSSLETGLTLEVQHQLSTSTTTTMTSTSNSSIHDPDLNLTDLKQALDAEISRRLSSLLQNIDLVEKQNVGKQTTRHHLDGDDPRWTLLSSAADDIVSSQLRELALIRVDQYLECWGVKGARLLSAGKIEEIKRRGLEMAGWVSGG